jgi:hypothetical protein
VPYRALRRSLFSHPNKTRHEINPILKSNLAPPPTTIISSPVVLLDDPSSPIIRNGELPKSRLLNAISNDIINQYLTKELQHNSKTDKVTGCIYSTRMPENKGYVRIQLAQKHIPKDILKAVQVEKNSKKWVDIKCVFKVALHQLAYKAHIGYLPDKNDADIVHKCGHGKNAGDNNCCFNPQHLGSSSHKDNMHAQNCIPLHTCPNCLTVFKDCQHSPQCLGSLSMETKAKEDNNIQQKDKKIVTVIYVYDDGSVTTKTLDK